ncbi:hypothetical protein C9374_013178 [Naegleria lovaniensis]|uniref:Uncharacterized protein n=1 Tax=Naegleria lovaniensis TaxID=51637 RepID=A0AA88KDC8_NAELO|nr:uncharacterized protein C9374_013178 [Naegleria lovaniensis]KAG2372814.1 hypothetical protein C9374_013178 [Naegleria lovaniensis]
MFLFTSKSTSPQEQPPLPCHKILLLGTLESGKSTIFKQIPLIFGDGFSMEARRNVKPWILSSVIDNMRILIQGMKTLNLFFSNEENIQREKKILELNYYECWTIYEVWNDQLVQDIFELLKEPAIVQVLSKRNEFQIHDSATYFFEHLNRISMKDYVPSDEDMIRVRIKSTGFADQNFTINTQSLCLMDVGGARNERKKWQLHVNVCEHIIYCCSLSEFDQLCYEDDSTNRMKESLSAFEHVLTNILTPTQPHHVYLVFTKLDIFEHKIKNGSRLADTFEEYKGPEKDPMAALDFITEMYLAKDVLKRVKEVFYVNALDSNNVKQTIQQIAKHI